MKRLALIFLLSLSCCVLRAQFSLTGSDPGNVRWMKTESDGFKIIYPESRDSLARVYGAWLEKARLAVSWSSGMRIGEYQKGKTPIILHTFKPVANASVIWAPKRMDIFTTPDPYSPTPIKWEKLLAIHEGRHASQMQAGAGGRNKLFGYLTGEIFAGAAAGLYAGQTILEGDAVVAETALTESGRGRQADFLSYMYPAFDRGDWRDYWRWSLGSEKYYAPDHYRAGYMLVSGMRVFFNDPLFTEEYSSRVRNGGFSLLRKTIKQASGMGVKKAFRSIEESYYRVWSDEAAARSPFMPSSQVSKSPWRHTAYSGLVIDRDGELWSIKSGLTVPGSLVKTTASGNESRKSSFAAYSSELSYDMAGNKIWWSETVPDHRWTLGGSSRIRFLELSEGAKARDLTKTGKYFNPAPSPDGKHISATEYPLKGESRLAILNAVDGTVEREIDAPGAIQITESAWIGESLFVAGLSEEGMGLYKIAENRLINILEPRLVMLSRLRPAPALPNIKGPGLTFISDRSGVVEMYAIDLRDNSLTQLTSTRYGISSPEFNPKADTLYYSSLAPSDKPEASEQGWMIYATATKDLPMRVVSFGDIHKYPVAEALSAQEKELAGNNWDLVKNSPEPSFSNPVRHRKLPPVIHSWAPIYFNYDNVESISLDDYYKTASLGATALFQNLVGDGYGFVGYGFHEDPDLSGVWRHSGHFKYVYRGLFPVIEFSADIGDRASKEICRVQQEDPEKKSLSIFTSSLRRGAPYIESALRAYIPFNFSSGGISRGLVPQMKVRLTNDLYNDAIELRQVIRDDETEETLTFKQLGKERISALGSVDLALRGYITREKAPSQVYPSLGIGVEAGFRARPGHKSSFGNSVYLYSYGYLPGILQNQGVRLTATFGKEIGGSEFSYPDIQISTTPRGFATSTLKSLCNSCSPERYRFSVDYAIPLLNLDWSWLSPVVYMKNITVTPFLDCAFLKFKYSSDFHINYHNVSSDFIMSAGGDLTINLGNFLWLPYDCRIGVRYARNTWRNLDKFKISGLEKHFIGAIFDISL